MTTFKFTQMKKPGGLTTELVESLRSEILKGSYKVGDKLPSSKIIEEQTQVSRTVVREAIAQLKAEGLVDSRQGVGVFITERKNDKSFQIDKVEFESIHNAIQILELRLSVEVEMGGMAAERRTEEQMEEITKCMISMEEKGKNGEDSISEDFAFHKAIANASGNPYFVRLIEYIGSGVIPAREMITQYSNSFNNEKLLSVIQEEHRQIWRAIKNQDKSSAREAIKEHLGNSINRHIQIKEQHSAAS